MVKLNCLDEAKSILLCASDKTGWDFNTMLDIICDYLNETHGTYKFKKYVEELTDEELEFIEPIDF